MFDYAHELDILILRKLQFNKTDNVTKLKEGKPNPIQGM